MLYTFEKFTVLRPDFAETGVGWETLDKGEIYGLPELQPRAGALFGGVPIGYTGDTSFQGCIDFLEDVYGYRIRGVAGTQNRGGE